jgi:hypothetical protein
MGSFVPEIIEPADQQIYTLYERLQSGLVLWQVIQCADNDIKIIVCRDSPEVRRLLQPSVSFPSSTRTPLPSTATSNIPPTPSSPTPKLYRRLVSSHGQTPSVPQPDPPATPPVPQSSRPDQEGQDQEQATESESSPSPPRSDPNGVVHITISPTKLKKRAPVHHTVKNLRKVESGRICKASARSSALPRSVSHVSDSDDGSETRSIIGTSREPSPLPTKDERLLSPEHDHWFRAQQWQSVNKGQLSVRLCEKVEWPIADRLALRVRLYDFAHEVANAAVARQWRSLLHLWRQDQLNLRPTSAGKITHTPEQPFTALEAQFLHLYRTTTTERGRAVWLAITDKIRQAKLHVAFEKIVAAESPAPIASTAMTVFGVDSQETRLVDLHHKGTDIRDRCRAHLFYLLYPETQRRYRRTHGYPSKIVETGPKREWQNFTRRLRIAERWHTIQQTLTIGGISLMSERLMRWLDREDGGGDTGCKPREFKLWLACLPRFNPRAYEQCLSWGYTMQRAVESGHLTEGQHQLEMLSSEELDRIQDISKLFDYLPVTDTLEAPRLLPSRLSEAGSVDTPGRIADQFMDQHVFCTDQVVAPGLRYHDLSSSQYSSLPSLPPLQPGQDSFPADYCSGLQPSSSLSEDYTIL